MGPLELLQLLGGLGGIFSGNQLGSQGTANWEQAGNSIYQPQFTQQADTGLWNKINTPTQGYQAMQSMLADLMNPTGAQNSAITESVRSGMADRGLSTSPLGSVMEAQQLIPALSQARTGAANSLQGMDMQTLQALAQYLSGGINAGAQKGNLLAGIGSQQVALGDKMGTQSGTAIGKTLGDIFGNNSVYTPGDLRTQAGIPTNPQLGNPYPNPYARGW